MVTFIIGLIILVLGYVFYSRYVDKVFAPDDRKTPASELNDGVDYVSMGKNRDALIHLLNIGLVHSLIFYLQLRSYSL